LEVPVTCKEKGPQYQGAVEQMWHEVFKQTLQTIFRWDIFCQQNVCKKY